MSKALECSGLKAIHDWQPVRPGKLSITGVCNVPTPRYRIVLKRKVPQGINPAILLLKKEVIRPQGWQLQVITPTPVSYEEVPKRSFQKVTILPDNTTFDVQDVY